MHGSLDTLYRSRSHARHHFEACHRRVSDILHAVFLPRPTSKRRSILQVYHDLNVGAALQYCTAASNKRQDRSWLSCCDLCGGTFDSGGGHPAERRGANRTGPAAS